MPKTINRKTKIHENTPPALNNFYKNLQKLLAGPKPVGKSFYNDKKAVPDFRLDLKDPKHLGLIKMLRVTGGENGNVIPDGDPLPENVNVEVQYPFMPMRNGRYVKNAPKGDVSDHRWMLDNQTPLDASAEDGKIRCDLSDEQLNAIFEAAKNNRLSVETPGFTVANGDDTYIIRADEEGNVELVSSKAVTGYYKTEYDRIYRENKKNPGSVPEKPENMEFERYYQYNAVLCGSLANLDDEEAMRATQNTKAAELDFWCAKYYGVQPLTRKQIEKGNAFYENRPDSISLSGEDLYQYQVVRNGRLVPLFDRDDPQLVSADKSSRADDYIRWKIADVIAKCSIYYRLPDGTPRRMMLDEHGRFVSVSVSEMERSVEQRSLLGRIGAWLKSKFSKTAAAKERLRDETIRDGAMVKAHFDEIEEREHGERVERARQRLIERGEDTDEVSVEKEAELIRKTDNDCIGMMRDFAEYNPEKMAQLSDKEKAIVRSNLWEMICRKNVESRKLEDIRNSGDRSFVCPDMTGHITDGYIALMSANRSDELIDNLKVPCYMTDVMNYVSCTRIASGMNGKEKVIGDIEKLEDQSKYFPEITKEIYPDITIAKMRYESDKIAKNPDGTPDPESVRSCLAEESVQLERRMNEKKLADVSKSDLISAVGAEPVEDVSGKKSPDELLFH